MDSPWLVAAITIVLIAASAFFVAIEFALIAARRHRLEDAAPTSRAARAALRSASELTVLLAGSQLGITVCALLLGAVTKPAVHLWLTPAFQGLGAPLWIADVAGFVLAILIVTFLHLVVGEMAPKSWAIAHPEKSAILLAIPMRGFIQLTRPLLVSLNRAANWFLIRVGVQPVDEVASGRDPDTLRHLVEHSATVGTLDERYHGQLTSALELQTLSVGDIVQPNTEPSSVAPEATAADIRAAGQRSGHLRLLVRSDAGVEGVIHVRDSLQAPAACTARALMRPVLAIPADTAVYEALGTMRETRNHLAIVLDGEGEAAGLVTLTDVLQRLLPVNGTTDRPTTVRNS